MANLGYSDVHYFDSTMTEAPELRYLAGSLIGLLDACLINGFGSQAPQGAWEKVFSGTNKAVYRSTDTHGARCYLRVNDTAAGAARVVGYEAMSTIDAGDGPFPTAAQFSGGMYAKKATDSGDNPKTWALYCDSRAFYYMARTSRIAYDHGYDGGLVFGDCVNYKTDDAYHSIIMACPGATSDFVLNRIGVGVAGDGAAYIARGAGQTGGSLTLARYATGRQEWVGTPGIYPSVDGQLHVHPILCWGSDGMLRGALPGFFSPESGNTLADGTIIEDTVYGVPNRNFMIRNLNYSSSVYYGAFDLTGPWRDDGALSISGVVTELNVPGAYRVFLHRQSDMQLVDTTWSSAVDGSYSFTGLKSQPYVVIATDHTDPIRSPAIQYNVVPS